jgi:hypothetical protein
MHHLIKALGIIGTAYFMSNGLALAQGAPKPNELYTQQCIQQQRSIHQGLKDKLSDADFKPYCSCFIGALEKRLTLEQFRALGESTKGAKPVWLKQAESQAGRSCIPSEPKLQV